MIITDKEINLLQLDNELGGHGLCMNDNDPNKKIISTADNSPISEAELKAAIIAHKAKPVAEATVAEKLASVGLSIDDLKAALA
jgi:hypothetical protein